MSIQRFASLAFLLVGIAFVVMDGLELPNPLSDSKDVRHFDIIADIPSLKR